MKRARSPSSEGEKRAKHNQISFCVNGATEHIMHIAGRSIFFDAILETESPVFATGSCDHSACLKIERLQSPNFIKMLPFLGGKQVLAGIPFRELLVLVDFLLVSRTHLFSAINAEISLDDWVVLHFKQMQPDLNKYQPVSKKLMNNPSLALPVWPQPPVCPIGVFTFDLDQACAAIMAEPQVGTFLERLAIVRRLRPEAVALHQVSSEFSSTPAHEAMVAAITQEVFDVLPSSAIVAGGALVCAVGNAPWLPGSDIDVFVPEPVPDFIAALVGLGFRDESQPGAQAVWTGSKNGLKLQVITSTTTTDVTNLLAHFDWDYTQIAWLPSQSKVVATLDCWRALLTRECRVIVRTFEQARFEKMEAKGFSISAELAALDYRKETVAQNFEDFVNYEKFALTPFANTPIVWPCAPFSKLFSHADTAAAGWGGLYREVLGPYIVTPRVYSAFCAVHFDSSWSAEHALFARNIDSLHEALGSKPSVHRDGFSYSLPCGRFSGTDLREGWYRLEIKPSYTHPTKPEELWWRIRAFVAHPE